MMSRRGNCAAAASDPTPTDAPKEHATVDGIGAKLAQASILDVAFALDCTASMGPYIAAAQRSIATIADKIVAAEKADVRFALVEYRDHPPQDKTFVTRVTPFTPSVMQMKQQLDCCCAHGGGDTPEAVADALHECHTLGWREGATKITVLVCDAPPHGLGRGHDGFPQGSPNGHDPVDICHKMAADGITMYTIGCEPAINQWIEFFEGMSHITGGQYCGLSSANGLCDIIVGGAREEMALERMMVEAEAEVESTGVNADEDQQAAALFSVLSAKKATAAELRRGGKAYAPSPVAQKLKKSGAKTLSSYSKAWRSEQPAEPMHRGEGASLFCGTPSTRRMGCSRSAAPARRSLGGLSGGGPPAPSALAVSFEAADSYATVESPVSMAQCSRMVSKSRARKGW